jgi:hypothetical protein
LPAAWLERHVLLLRLAWEERLVWPVVRQACLLREAFASPLAFAHQPSISLVKTLTHITCRDESQIPRMLFGGGHQR